MVGLKTFARVLMSLLKPVLRLAGSNCALGLRQSCEEGIIKEIRSRGVGIAGEETGLFKLGSVRTTGGVGQSDYKLVG